MKSRGRLVRGLLLMGVMAIAGVGGSMEVLAQERDEAVASELRAVLVDMWDAIEQEDLERYARHVHPDFTSFGESDPYLNEGKAYELRATADWLSRVERVHTDMHQPEVTVMGDTAWMTYYWTDAGYRSDGTRYTSQGKSTRIFVRVDGRWLCIHGHYTAT